MRNQFFAGTRGAGDHGDTIVRRHALDAVVDLQHLRTAADHAVESEVFEQALVEFQSLAAQAGILEDVGHALPQRFGGEGLRQAVTRSPADVCDG